jgi:zinc transport system permease protein
MLNELYSLFSLSFIWRAIAVGVLISFCSALLGVSLVLKRYSMIGDGLSHIAFGSLAITTVLNTAPMLLTVIIVTLSSVALLKFGKKTKLSGDSTVAIIATSSLAIGVFILSKTGANTDLSNYLFGSILSISNFDAVFCVALSSVIILLFILFYNRIFAVTFDESFSKATGVKADALNTVIAVLTALTIVVGMRLMGTLLISSLIIFSPVSAMYICKTFKSVTIASALISVLNFIIGIIASFLLSAPTGATIVIVSLITLLICYLISKLNIMKNPQT